MASPDDSNEKKQVDIAQMVREMRENMIARLEWESLRAQIAFKRYTELRAAGFNEVQALEIIKGSY